MSLYRRGEVWWLYIVHKGERVRQSCETSNRESAQAIHDRVRAELWKLKPDSETLHDALDAWEAAAPRSSSDRYRLGKLRKLIPLSPLQFLNVEDMKLPNTTPGTFNRYAGMVIAALNLAKKKGWIETVPHIGLKRIPTVRNRWITPKEWRALKKELPDHLRDMAEFALLTGLRQRNVTHLEWSQVDLKRRTAWIHADQAKGKRSIGVPLSDRAVTLLNGRKGQSDQWVFPYKGKPLGKIKSAWRKALKRAKLEGVTWHTLRHTWASYHAMRGTPISALKELGGWSTLSMVTRYSHLAPEHLRQYAGAAGEYLGHKVTPQSRKKRVSR